MLRILRSLTFIYLGVTLGCSMLQEQMIFPGKSSQGQSWANLLSSEDRDVVMLDTSAGDKVAVLFGKAVNPDGTHRADASTRPTLVVFYGNGMALVDLVELTRGWRKLGANVIGMEYPGYGMSSGKPGEAAFYSAANATWDYLARRGDVDMTRIIPTGISIGSGVATELAHTHPASGLILISPLTSLDDRAAELLPLFPTRLILRHHFDNRKKIANLKIPILMFHGKNDQIVPAQMSEELRRAAVASPKVQRIVFDTDHNDIFELSQDQIDAEMARFIDQIAITPPR